MYTEFHLNANALNINFLEGIKAIYKSKPITIIIEESTDETEYLLAGEANRKMLEESLASEEGYEFSAKEFSKFSLDLAKGKKVDLSKIKKVKLPK